MAQGRKTSGGAGRWDNGMRSEMGNAPRVSSHVWSYENDGPAALTALARRSNQLRHALPRHSFYAVHAEPRLFFEPADFSKLLADPGIVGLHVSPKGRGGEKPMAGSLYAWAAEKFGG